MSELDHNSPHHEITHRPATDEELAEFIQIMDVRRPLGWGRLIIASSLMAIVVGGCVSALGDMAKPGLGQPIAMVVIPAIGIACLLPGAGYRTSNAKRHRETVQADTSQRTIAVLHCQNARWYEVIIRNDYAPAILCDLGEGKRLLIEAQWSLYLSLYGMPEDVLEERLQHGHAETERTSAFNGCEPPYAFPTSEFVIEYWPHTNYPHAIRPVGETADWQPVHVESLRNVGWNGESFLVFEGDPGLTDAETGRPVELSGQSLSKPTE